MKKRGGKADFRNNTFFLGFVIKHKNHSIFLRCGIFNSFKREKTSLGVFILVLSKCKESSFNSFIIFSKISELLSLCNLPHIYFNTSYFKKIWDFKVDMNNLKHIAIIPDGNRRFAKKHLLNFQQAYKKGVQNILEITEYLSNIKEIKTITFYAMSLDNYKKREKERKIIFEIINKVIEKAEEKINKKNNIRIQIIGELEKIPENIKKKIDKINQKIKKNEKTIYLAMAYSGKKEIEQAVKKIKGKINIKEIKNNLYIKEDVDLMIRTGGYKRLSDFLIWQNAYAEFYFTKKLWPEFTTKDLEKAIEKYKETKRNFGK